MENETLIQKALRLISTVPANQFITSRFTNSENRCCTVGHVYRLLSDNPDDYNFMVNNDETVSELYNTVNKYLQEKYRICDSIYSVNDRSTVNGFNSPVIKERTVALFTEMVAAGY